MKSLSISFQKILIIIVFFAASAYGSFETANILLEEDQVKTLKWTSATLEPPAGFPLELSLTHYHNWAHDIIRCFVWTAYPQNADDVVAAANWAMVNKYNLHASGSMHNWSPLTLVNTEKHSEFFSCGIGNGTWEQLLLHEPSRVILLKTSALNRMEVTSTDPGDSYFWTEPGVLLENLVNKLEDNNLSLYALPSTGNITMGGVLALGAHGTGIPATGQKLSKGHTYGSLSNLIMYFTAAVYDENFGEYILKEFQRSDPEAKAFMVNLGRTFITNFTLRAGPLQYLRCQSHVKIPATSLFAPTEGPDSFSALLRKFGRLESITYPFTTHPWLKVWVEEPVKPFFSRHVTHPYNYPFTDNVPEPVSLLIKSMVEHKFYNLSRLIGKTQYATTVAGLAATKSFDIWGPSKNTLLYIRSTTLRATAIGFAVLTAGDSLQRVVHEIYTFVNNLLLSYESRGMFPLNGAIEVRATGLDNLDDVMIRGAQNIAMSTLRLVDGSGFDTAVWFSIETFYETPSSAQFMRDVEQFIYRTYDGRWGLARCEWSKGWAYTDGGPWTNKKVFDDDIKTSYQLPDYNSFVGTMVKHDPYFIFTNRFTRSFFV